MFSWLAHGQRAGAKLFWIDMAIPTLIGDSGIIVALVTELRLVAVTAHAGTIQIHGMSFLVTRCINSNAVADDRFLPILQKILVIDPDVGFGLYAFLLIGRKFGLRNITGFSTHRIMPNRIGDQPKKDDQA